MQRVIAVHPVGLALTTETQDSGKYIQRLDQLPLNINYKTESEQIRIKRVNLRNVEIRIANQVHLISMIAPDPPPEDLTQLKRTAATTAPTATDLFFGSLAIKNKGMGWSRRAAVLTTEHLKLMKEGARQVQRFVDTRSTWPFRSCLQRSRTEKKGSASSFCGHAMPSTSSRLSAPRSDVRLTAGFRRLVSPV